MATITQLFNGDYAIENVGKLPFLTMNRRQLRELLEALDQAGLIKLDRPTSRVTLQ